jgi:hypothetical protein
MNEIPTSGNGIWFSTEEIGVLSLTGGVGLTHCRFQQGATQRIYLNLCSIMAPKQ